MKKTHNVSTVHKIYLNKLNQIRNNLQQNWEYFCSRNGPNGCLVENTKKLTKKWTHYTLLDRKFFQMKLLLKNEIYQLLFFQHAAVQKLLIED